MLEASQQNFITKQLIGHAQTLVGNGSLFLLLDVSHSSHTRLNLQLLMLVERELVHDQFQEHAPKLLTQLVDMPN